MRKNFWTALFAATVIFLPAGAPFAHAAPPAGFQKQQLASGLAQPTDFALAPDGRIFITQKGGTVVLYKNGALLPAPALTLSSVTTGGDRGLLSVALDPNFSTNHYAYLAYTTGASHERISRFTAEGDTLDPASELVLLEDPATLSGFLNAITIRYNPVDGKLYASLGSDGLSSNSQDLSSLEGKLLRINLDGSIPADNPFANVQGARGEIWSYGLRNPWKINVDTDGSVLIGDVGENLWEKIARSARGANFGWPMSEGDCRTTNSCGGITPPLYVYPHNGAGAAVLGGDVYKGGAFPAAYQHAYFYGDYVSGYINALTFDGNGNAAATSTFDTGLGALSAINYAPDGCLYYLTIFPGALQRYCYGNVQPTLSASAAASPAYGALPLAVTFSSAGSTDSSGAPLSYAWDFGDGASGSGASPSHTYTQKGVYTVTLTVSSANGSATATAKVWAGYLPPNPTISAPSRGAHYNDGDVIAFSGSATDPQDGALPAGSLSWVVTFHHNTHIHSPTSFVGVSGGSFTVPVADEPSPVTWYEIALTAKNSAGLASTSVIDIYPNTAPITYTSNPSGAQLLLDAQPIATPYTDVSVVGFHHTLSINSPQTINGASYDFSSWSNGGTQTQTLITPSAPATVTATLSPGTAAVQNITSTANLDAPTYNAGQALFATAIVTDSANLTNALVDIEIWGPGGKLAQHTSPANFVAGQPLSVSWDTAAPAGAGAYTVKIGVFSSDWSTLYQWNDAAATFTVTGSAPPPPTYTDSVAINGTNFSPSSPATVTATIGSDQDSPNLLLDLELSNASGKVLQQVTPVSLLANQPVSIPWNLTTPAAQGTYAVKVGLFSQDWAKLYRWDNAAGTIQVGAPPAIPAFVASASLPNTVFSPGAATTITTNVTATGNLANVIIDTEVYDANLNLAFQNIVPANLTANQLFSSPWNVTLPTAPGEYTVKVGVFAGDWSQMYLWQNRAFRFSVGAPPGTPQPGVTYPVAIQDVPVTATLHEYRGVINGLDINSYDLWWQVDGGTLKNLDTDPVTLAFKHAWIDFSTWNWSPTGVYQLRFVATDLANHEIGSSTVTIVH